MSLNLDKSAWKRVTFGDVVRNINDTVRNPEEAGIDRIIAMEHLDPGELRVARWGSLDDGTTFARRVWPGQTLFGKRRAYQRKVAYADFTAICSGDILTFETDNSQFLPELLPFLVQSNGFFDHALGTSAGSLSPRTNWRDLANFEFDLPPLDEQQRIADLLWAIERHRLVTKQAADAALELLVQMRADMFARSDDRVSATDAFDITIGRQRAPQYESGEHMVQYLRSANVTLEGVDVSDVKMMNFDPREQARFSLKAGDVLVSEASASASAVGMPAVWNMQLPGVVCFQNTLLRYRAIDGVTLPGFTEQYCRWAFESGQFLSAASGTNIRHIGLGGSTAMSVCLPTTEDQQTFVERVSAMDAVASSFNSEALALSMLSSALISQVFGEK